MTDSTRVFDPGFRVTNSDGTPAAGAVISFTNASTSLPMTVYADADLSTALGTEVTCDDAGYPANSGARTLIWVGTTAYNVTCVNSLGATLWTHTEVTGALDTSGFLTTPSTTINYTMTAVSATGTWTLEDLSNAVMAINPGGSALVRTLPAASTSDGAAFDVTHIGTSGTVSIKTAGSDIIYADGTDTARKVVLLVSKGDSARIYCDGSSWYAVFKRDTYAPRSFTVESQVTSPPASPSTGAAYVIIGTPGGGFTTTTPACADGDVVVYDGQSNWNIFRPSTNCGWLIYDKNTSKMFVYRASTWDDMAATDSAIGLLQRATQAEQETGTAVDRAVTSGRQHYHNSAAKAWGTVTGATGSIVTSYNTSSVSRTGAGAYTINFTTALSSSSYVVILSAKISSTYLYMGSAWGTKSSSSVTVTFTGVAAGGGTTAADPTTFDYAVYGDM